VAEEGPDDDDGMKGELNDPQGDALPACAIDLFFSKRVPFMVSFAIGKFLQYHIIHQTRGD
jgi:hypothetical protein